MNERIRELAEQAGYNGHYATEEFDVDKFAELIVQECARVARKTDLEDVEVGAYAAAEVLRERLGVKAYASSRMD